MIDTDRECPDCGAWMTEEEYGGHADAHRMSEAMLRARVQELEAALRDLLAVLDSEGPYTEAEARARAALAKGEP